MKKYSDFEMFSKDQAYWERNQLVCALSKIWPSHIEMHPLEDGSWDDDWRTIIVINSPSGQLTWHIHDSEVDQFTHLNIEEGSSWDGHTTEEKYERLRSIDVRQQDK